MAAALPLPVRLKLDQTLAQWRHWQCGPPLDAPPPFVAPLAAGHSNHSLLVGESRQFVVRIDGVDPAAHGINRQAEWLALQDAHAVGLAPRPCYFNPDLGTLVCEYLQPDAAQHHELGQVATLLRGIHRLPLRHSRLDLRQRIRRYEHQLARPGAPLPRTLSETRDRVFHRLSRVTARDHSRAMCHNDLLRGNRLVSGGRLWAIDWEYCAVGDPLYELAVIICGDDLSGKDAEELVACYLGREASAGERGAMLDYCCVYRYLELLWYLAQRHPALDAGRQEKAIGLLLDALERTA